MITLRKKTLTAFQRHMDQAIKQTPTVTGLDPKSVEAKGVMRQLKLEKRLILRYAKSRKLDPFEVHYCYITSTARVPESDVAIERLIKTCADDLAAKD